MAVSTMVDDRPQVAQLVSGGTLVIDQTGRRWCMLGRHGFTRVEGLWWWGSPAELVCQVTAPAVLTALDTWCTRHTGWIPATDFTPAHGIERRPS